MKTLYTKMNSQGNDFIVIDTSSQNFLQSQENIIAISSSENVGCDQVLLIDTSQPNHVNCKIYNSDGSSACQCGNGLRAIMLYLNRKFSVSKSTIVICNKSYSADIVDEQRISVNLGIPTFSEMSGEAFDDFNNLSGLIVDVGNKHAVIQNQNLDDILSLDQIHSFLAGTYVKSMQNDLNFTFIQEGTIRDNKNYLRVKVKERGAGFTKSCGSGASAAAACHLIYNENVIKNSSVMIQQEGGVLEVNLDIDGSIVLTGPSELEQEGVWDE